jgi:phenylalanyl-tRNA synthetase alpha chain
LISVAHLTIDFQTLFNMEIVLQEILNLAQAEALKVDTRSAFEAFKASLFGANGHLTQVLKQLGQLPKEDRPVMGKRINELKQQLEVLLNTRLLVIEKHEAQTLLGAPIDPTLPVMEPSGGTRHPLAQVSNQIVAIFKKMGFCQVAGTEVETEWYCFDALNTPADHPARDAQDSLYLPLNAHVETVTKHTQERYVLRTHTSSVQVRHMLAHQPPVRIVSLGRAFRRDTVDATHSSNFHQIEGLYVDKNVSVRDLKAVLDYFLNELFGTAVESRLRPHFFPFTEPSFEVDMRLKHFGKLSNQWIEIFGCGMVDPEVFKNVNYDSQIYSGYAFGMGIERLAMLLLGVDDIRYFYQNDWRFLKQFR